MESRLAGNIGKYDVFQGRGSHLRRLAGSAIVAAAVNLAGTMALVSAPGPVLPAASPHQATGSASPSNERPLAQASAASSAVDERRALLNKSCVTCHNARSKAGGLLLDTVDTQRVAADGAAWEKVVRKLHAGTMPPAGAPRPDRPVLEGLIASLETELDRAAAARVNPGRTAAFHRLNRTDTKMPLRSARSRRHRHLGDAPGRRHELRLRQHRRRPETVIVAARTLSLGREEDQPPGGERFERSFRQQEYFVGRISPSTSIRTACRWAAAAGFGFATISRSMATTS